MKSESKHCKCPFCGREVTVNVGTCESTHKMPACKSWLELVKRFDGVESPVMKMGGKESGREEKRTQVP